MQLAGPFKHLKNVRCIDKVCFHTCGQVHARPAYSNSFVSAASLTYYTPASCMPMLFSQESFSGFYAKRLMHCYSSTHTTGIVLSLVLSPADSFV